MINIFYHSLAVSAVSLGSISQIILKYGVIKDNDDRSINIKYYFMAISYFMTMLSGFLLFFSLREVPLKDMAFILPIAYILTPLLSNFFLGEHLTANQKYSVAIIVLGIAIFNMP